MPKYRRVRFKILGFTPDTLPMARLAEYISDFAMLLGHDHAAHFRRVEDGSAELVSDIDEPDFPSVRKRVLDAAKGLGPQEAVLGYRGMNAKLKEDKTSGEMQGDRGAKILQFPGVVAEPAATFGPFNQQGTIDGVLIKIGGRGQIIPVHIEDGGRIWICNATREMTKKLAPHIFGDPIRLHGTGRWTRDSNGVWTLIGFNIASFDELNNDPLPVVIERLKAIPDNGWATVNDPLGELKRIRKGDSKAH